MVFDSWTERKKYKKWNKYDPVGFTSSVKGQVLGSKKSVVSNLWAPLCLYDSISKYTGIWNYYLSFSFLVTQNCIFLIWKHFFLETK